MKKITFLVLFFISAGNCFGQQVTFQKTYGGTGWNFGQSVCQTTDGGYIITGSTDYDVYLVKTDSYGDALWTRTYGGTSPVGELAHSVQQTIDGGYIVVGKTFSFGAGAFDILLIKTDGAGNLVWSKIYGSTGYDDGYTVKQTSDGGYIIAGFTEDYGAGGNDIYLIKTDVNGDSTWTRTFGGLYIEEGYSVEETNDSGFIIAGQTSSFGTGSADIFLIKTDDTGYLLWTKTLGGTDYESANSIQQTTDGGYIVTGIAENSGAGWADAFLIKTDSAGVPLWAKTYGGTDNEIGNYVQQTDDGGYIIAGNTFSFGAGNADVYIIKTNAFGDLSWSKTYGGISEDVGYSILQTTDGGYVVACTSYSFGAGVDNVYLIKTDSFGNSGCNEGNPLTITNTFPNQLTNPLTLVSSGGIITNPAIIVGSGGTFNALCPTGNLQPLIHNPQSEITISPNPTTNNFTLTFPNTINKGAIEIYNVLGEKIFSEDVFNVSQKEIRLDNINAGIYFVKIKDGEREYCKKLVIE